MRKLFSLIILAPCFAEAQIDSSFQDKSLNIIKSENIDNEIYNGRQHLGYPSSITGIAYYQTTQWQPGTIVYRNVYYPQVFLKYDLVQNEVIIRHFDGNIGVTLFTPRIERFSLAEKNFLLFKQTGKSFPPPGLYEETEKGKVSFYIHRSKFIRETIAGLQIEREFIIKDTYYALKGGTWYPIKKEKYLMELVKDKKKEIKNDLKKKGIRYRTNPEATLIEIVSYYNKATN